MSLTTVASSPSHTGSVLSVKAGAPTTSTDWTVGSDEPHVLVALTASTYSPRFSRAVGGRAKLNDGPLHPRPDADTSSLSKVAPMGPINVYVKVVNSGPVELVDIEAVSRSPAHNTAL